MISAAKFSERHGHVPYPPPLQLTDLDDRTRANRWNLIYLYFINARYPPVDLSSIWMAFLSRYLHEYTPMALENELLAIVTKRRYPQVFDLLEFLLQQTRGQEQAVLHRQVNELFALNRVGYRLGVDQLITPITDEHELASIELAAGSDLSEVRTHMRNAVTLFADRDNPSFAKSISESISAVEAAARDLAGKPSATLELALKVIKDDPAIDLHPTLTQGWSKLYAFAGDAGGIRHALKEGTLSPTPEMAQYFLVTCSAFVNLLASLKPNQH